MQAAFRVFAAVQENGKTLFGQQSAVFLGPETRVIQLMAEEIADGCAFRRPAREEKQALGAYAPKNGKHRPLIVRRQVKETVPRMIASNSG
jgi:hypothetical protein